MSQYLEDVPQLISERYTLMMRRERWRGAVTGIALCQTVLFALWIAERLTVGASSSNWVTFCGPLTQLFALWRQHVAAKRIDEIDGGFRETVKAAPAPKEKALN